MDGFNYGSWHFITSFIDHTIQIYVGQKAMYTENQRRAMVLEEFLHTALLYQATNTRNINALAVLKQFLVIIIITMINFSKDGFHKRLKCLYKVVRVKKEQWGDFSVQSDFVSA